MKILEDKMKYNKSLNRILKTPCIFRTVFFKQYTAQNKVKDVGVKNFSQIY